MLVVPKWAGKYKTITVEVAADGVGVATLDAKDPGGCNLLTGALFKDFVDMIKKVAKDWKTILPRSAELRRKS